MVFPRLYETLKGKLQIDRVILLKAKIDYRDEELCLIADKITIPEESLLAEVPESRRHEIFIPRKTGKETLQQLGQLLKAEPGEDQVVIVIPNGSTPKHMVLPYGVAWSDSLSIKVTKLLE